MKNKEIEELLKNIKDKYSYEPYDNTGEVYTTISYEEGQLLLSHIEQLENNRDKAIEYTESHFIFNDKTGECYQTHTFDKDNVKKLYDILKGDSDD